VKSQETASAFEYGEIKLSVEQDARFKQTRD